MFQYLMHPQLRPANDFIESLSFFSQERKFRDINLIKIRAIIKGEQLSKDTDFFSKCFQVFENAKQKPKKMLRVLIFIHLLLQTEVTKCQQLSSLLNQQISDILTNSKSYRQKKQRASTASSASAVQQNNQTQSQTQFNTNTNTNNNDDSLSPNAQQIVGSISDISQVSKTSKFSNSLSLNSQGSHISHKSSLITEKPQNYVSEKQVLCQKVIQPYAFYLMKKNFSGISGSCESFDSRQVQEIYIWQQLNILKLISKITSGFYVIGRYYDSNFFKMIIQLCPLLSQDIYKIYPKLSHKIRQKVDRVAKRHILSTVSIPSARSSKSLQKLSNKQNIGGLKSKQSLALQKAEKTEISQCKELLTEISQCNDNLVFFYMNKYLIDYLDLLGIQMPSLMCLESAECQYIFFKVQEEEKRSQRHMKKSEIIQKCKKNLLRDFNKIRKTTTCIDTSIEFHSPMTPVYEAMTPNRLPPRPKKFASKNSKTSSYANQKIDEIQQDRQ